MKKEPKKSTTTVVVETEMFSAEEERLLRMRAGASLPGDAALGSKLDAVAADALEEVSARLRLIEAQLIARHADADIGEVCDEPAADDERRARIVAALAKKHSA